jgi:hypothetical protein
LVFKLINFKEIDNTIKTLNLLIDYLNTIKDNILLSLRLDKYLSYLT